MRMYRGARRLWETRCYIRDLSITSERYITSPISTTSEISHSHYIRERIRDLPFPWHQRMRMGEEMLYQTSLHYIKDNPSDTLETSCRYVYTYGHICVEIWEGYKEGSQNLLCIVLCTMANALRSLMMKSETILVRCSEYLFYKYEYIYIYECVLIYRYGRDVGKWARLFSIYLYTREESCWDAYHLCYAGMFVWKGVNIFCI